MESNEPDASSRAGKLKRAKNLAAEELLIEVIAGRGWKIFGDTGVEHSIHRPDKYKKYSWSNDVRLR